MTFREVSLIISGYADRVVNQYRQTRLLMFMMAKMWGDPKKSPKTPEDLWQLPGDEVKGQMNEDEIAAIFEKLRQENDGRNA
jgi:hypothetical protein